MRYIFLFLLYLWPMSAMAAPIRVTSGEHEGFTRLVLDLQGPADWQVGRTADGYELSVGIPDARFDLSDAFRLIPRRRLVSLWPDPQTGNLHLGLACACHALPFELRPGIVVVDLRDGPAPPGASFEMSLQGSPMPALAPHAPARPMPRPADLQAALQLTGPEWRNLALQSARLNSAPLSVLPTTPDQPPLRDALITELSRGAAAGLIELARPPDGPPPAVGPTPEYLRFTLGDRPGLLIGPDRPSEGGLTAQGQACLPDDRLDIANWAGQTPIAEQFAAARSNLYGEFDHLDADSLTRGLKFYLSIGFGAEALQLLHLPGVTQGTESAVWQSMALLVDGKADPDSAFQDMAACDSAASLWAVLSKPDLTVQDHVNAAAVRRSFTALPTHLRRQLGPGLVERFLRLGDTETVRVLQAAQLRGLGGGAEAQSAARAAEALAKGQVEEAGAALAPLAQGNGAATALALVDQAKARLAAGLPVSPETVTALRALALEQRETEAAPDLQRLIALAEAGSGDFEAAFSALSDVPEATEGVWKILAEAAPDDEFLARAVLPEGAVPNLAGPLRQAVAERLLVLGLGAPAETWLGLPPLDPALAAQAMLLQGDARAALRQLTGAQQGKATEIRLAALEQLGEAEAVADLRQALADGAGAQRALAWAGDWAQLAQAGSDPWKDAAQGLETSSETGTAPGTLARSRATVELSSATRQQIADLLSAVPALP